MTHARRWSLKYLVVIMVVAVVGLMLFRDRLRPTARRAAKRATELGVVAFEAPELDDYVTGRTGSPVHAGMLLVRSLTPDSPILLLRQVGGTTVVEFDSLTGNKSPSTISAWDAATGEATDEAQFWSDYDGWTLSKDPPRLLRSGEAIRTAGKHVIRAVTSPHGDKVAVISADGSYRPGTGGFLFSTYQRATGQHFLDIFGCPDGKRLTAPVAIPLRTSKRGGLDHFWTADEGFIVCKDWQEKFCIVPTGMKAPYPPVSGVEAATAGYGVFPLSAWWEHFPHLRVLVRYEENRSAAFLMHSKAAGSTYRYDPTGRTLTLVEEAVWEKATGRIECSRFASPFGAGSSGCEEGAVEMRSDTNKEVPWAREGALTRTSLSPMHRAVAVTFRDTFANESPVHLQVFSWPELVPLTPVIEVGSWSPYWSPDGRYLMVIGARAQALLIETGLGPTNVVAAEPGRQRVVPFHPNGWVSGNAKNDPTLLCRYVDESDSVLLMRSLRGLEVYRYDPEAGEVVQAELAEWEAAIGAIWQPYEMVGRGQVLRPDSAKKRLRRLGSEIPVAGKESVCINVGSTLTRAVVLSKDEPRGEYFYQELYRLPEGTPIGAPLKLPRVVVDSGTPHHGWQPSPWDWGSEDRYILYMNWDQRRVCIVHTNLAPGD